MNMRAVFLHILGDFLGSVIVMITSGSLWLLGCNRAASLVPEAYQDYNFQCISAEMNLLDNSTENFQSSNGWFSSSSQCDKFIINNNGDSVLGDSTLENNLFGCYSVNNISRTVYYVEPSWTLIIDPFCSFCLVTLIACMTLPVLRAPILILFQT